MLFFVIFGGGFSPFRFSKFSGTYLYAREKGIGVSVFLNEHEILFSLIKCSCKPYLKFSLTINNVPGGLTKCAGFYLQWCDISGHNIIPRINYSVTLSLLFTVIRFVIFFVSKESNASLQVHKNDQHWSHA
jgi:hypothetical protein